jgi:hypothetical protein
MPWKPSDAKSHNSSLTTTKQQRAWAHIANSALDRCTKKGGDQKECEASAIKQANAMAKRIKETDDLFEAATTKHRAVALLRDLGTMLEDKAVTGEIRDMLKGVRDSLKKKWSDLSADVEPAEAESEMTMKVAAARLICEAGDVLRADDSVDAVRAQLNQALMRWAMGQMADDTESDPYYCESPYVQQMFDGAAIFYWNGDCYRVDYTVDDNDDVTITKVVAVDIAYVPSDDPEDMAEGDGDGDGEPTSEAAQVVGDETELVINEVEPLDVEIVETGDLVEA